MKNQFANYLTQCPVISILRGITGAEVPSVCDALYEGGLRLMEIPLNSPDPIASIALAVSHSGHRMMIGAGTVLTPRQVEEVAAAGGKYIVSPNMNPAVIAKTKELGLVSIPGIFTATEAFAAIDAGADYLKQFPAMLGPAYIKHLQAVISTPILAVGGITPDNVVPFLNVCCGVGIGGAIYKPGKHAAQIEKDTRSICQLIGARK